MVFKALFVGGTSWQKVEILYDEVELRQRLILNVFRGMRELIYALRTSTFLMRLQTKGINDGNAFFEKSGPKSTLSTAIVI